MGFGSTVPLVLGDCWDRNTQKRKLKYRKQKEEVGGGAWLRAGELRVEGRDGLGRPSGTGNQSQTLILSRLPCNSSSPAVASAHVLQSFADDRTDDNNPRNFRGGVVESDAAGYVN